MQRQLFPLSSIYFLGLLSFSLIAGCGSGAGDAKPDSTNNNPITNAPPTNPNQQTDPTSESPKDQTTTASPNDDLLIDASMNPIFSLAPAMPPLDAETHAFTPDEYHSAIGHTSETRNKYAGDWIEVSGNIEGIYESSTKRFSAVKVEGEFRSVTCYVKKAGLWKNMSHGNAIKVKGVVGNLGDLYHCTLNVTNGTPVPELASIELTKEFLGDSKTAIEKYALRQVIVTGKVTAANVLGPIPNRIEGTDGANPGFSNMSRTFFEPENVKVGKTVRILADVVPHEEDAPHGFFLAGVSYLD